ncbi:hypothetical protein FACS1894211_05550 [Clostridia bacterium]|nr:hypothetical protein FACS1894211_05550 [Clostridia bacterium]
MTLSKKRVALYMTYFTLFALALTTFIGGFVFAIIGLEAVGNSDPKFLWVGGLFVLLAALYGVFVLIFDIFSAFAKKRRFLSFIFIYSLLAVYIVAALFVFTAPTNVSVNAFNGLTVSVILLASNISIIPFMYALSTKIMESNGGAKVSEAETDEQVLALRSEIVALKKEAQLQELRKEIEDLKVSLKKQ